MKQHIERKVLTKKTKKNYYEPKLEIFGSITDMTNSTSTVGMGDGAKAGANKTSV